MSVIYDKEEMHPKKSTEETTFEAQEILEEYERYLCYSFVINSSFQEIVEGRLNKKRRRLHLLVLVVLGVYVVPRFAFLSAFYFQSKDVQDYYLYWFADYTQQVHGLLGKTWNALYIIFPSYLCINMTLLRRLEEKGSLSFVTDCIKYKQLKRRKNFNDELDESQTVDNELLKKLKWKTTVAKFLGRNGVISLGTYDVVTLVFYLCTVKPAALPAVLAVVNCIVCCCLYFPNCNFFMALYLSYEVTADSFTSSVKKLKKKIANFKENITDDGITGLLHKYDELLQTFKRHDQVLRQFLNFMVHFYLFGLSSLLFMTTIDAELWMKSVMIAAGACYSFMILKTGLCVGQVDSRLVELYHDLNSLSISIASKGNNVSLKTQIRLRLSIKELGNRQKDGQFVLGLRDGRGPPISRFQIFYLTTETIFNVLMIIQFVYH